MYLGSKLEDNGLEPCRRSETLGLPCPLRHVDERVERTRGAINTITIQYARNNNLMHAGPGPRGLHTGARLARPKTHSIPRCRLGDPTHGWYVLETRGETTLMVSTDHDQPQRNTTSTPSTQAPSSTCTTTTAATSGRATTSSKPTASKTSRPATCRRSKRKTP